MSMIWKSSSEKANHILKSDHFCEIFIALHHFNISTILELDLSIEQFLLPELVELCRVKRFLVELESYKFWENVIGCQSIDLAANGASLRYFIRLYRKMRAQLETPRTPTFSVRITYFLLISCEWWYFVHGDSTKSIPMKTLNKMPISTCLQNVNMREELDFKD